MIQPRIDIPQDQINNFCMRHHIVRMALFGSVITEAFNSDSDIDVLVEFDPNHIPGLKLIKMQDELSTIFGGRKVDLVTYKFINRRIKIEPQVIFKYA